MVDDKPSRVGESREILSAWRFDQRHIGEDHAEQVEIIRMLLAKFLSRHHLVVIPLQLPVGS